MIFAPAGMERAFDPFATLEAEALRPEVFAQTGAAVGMDVVGPPLGG